MEDQNLSKGSGESNNFDPPKHLIIASVSPDEADRYRKRLTSEEIEKQDAEEARFEVLQFVKKRAMSLGWSMVCAVSVTVVFEPAPPVVRAGITTLINWSGVTVVQALKKVWKPDQSSDP